MITGLRFNKLTNSMEQSPS